MKESKEIYRIRITKNKNKEGVWSRSEMNDFAEKQLNVLATKNLKLPFQIMQL